MKYIHNDIVKTFKDKIIRYTKSVREMHELDNYLPPPLIKGERTKVDNWNVCNQEFRASEFQLVIKDRLTLSMHDELENHPEDYHFLDLLRYV